MTTWTEKKRIKSPTIAKKAIAKQIELENLGEELRVLYVALTRAKRKAHSHRNLKRCDRKSGILQTAGESFESDRQTAFLPYKRRGFRLSGLDTSGSAFLWGQIPGRIVEAAELVLDEVENQLEQNEDLTERIGEIKAADPQLVGQLKRRFFAALSISG